MHVTFNELDSFLETNFFFDFEVDVDVVEVKVEFSDFVFSTEHDLLDMLSHVVKRESDHPKRDSSKLVLIQ